ncbi:hypothetical protein [Ammoniphilus sp. 3BR4]|uniref:hypothetical protein n=1 Tax=Ammoniphilus sp. 3BR4 TaxID=3158265 RepID=UPI003467BCF2
MQKWWEIDRIKDQLVMAEICQCKTEQKGRWLIVDPETMERAYVCVRCKRRVYPKTQ